MFSIEILVSGLDWIDTGIYDVRYPISFILEQIVIVLLSQYCITAYHRSGRF